MKKIITILPKALSSACAIIVSLIAAGIPAGTAAAQQNAAPASTEALFDVVNASVCTVSAVDAKGNATHRGSGFIIRGSGLLVTNAHVLAGLAELARVMRRGGRMLLLTTEDNFSGAWTSRVWCCRTYNRQELRRISDELGLAWKQELWFTRMHRLLKAGGICVEIVKQ
jgi:hypothetical protein